ncbi:TatD family deoxyribonuclease [Verticiella sediminum]|uniref:TatD family deoxyribonuclease n=1 Tax=Verticiella sediminum TaxID=1247510 RepID=A0A556AYX0_9BURK|nr:TatD family hydrolase [Verticiella sediminum]TSH98096.1 TatD family deoxyribonuclease [Verticiella sediminum]
MLIDTHCHLDAAEFDDDRAQVIAASRCAGVRAVVLPAIAPSNYAAVRELAHGMPGGAYALGIHPLLVSRTPDEAIDALRQAVQQALADPRFVAVGEIGLDLFVKEIASGVELQRQERFFAEQLRIAAEFDLPVLVHVRRSQDLVHKHLRRIPVRGGFAHAFNGSEQQADRFIAQGLALGVGGAMTYPRSLQIRRHAARVGLEHLVLETDAPDIPPAWLHPPNTRNAPAEVAGVARALAELRGDPVDEVVAATGATALRHLPRLAAHPDLADGAGSASTSVGT